MPKKRIPLLKAVEHNWGMLYDGVWSEVEWVIFSDGTYKKAISFNIIKKDGRRANARRKKTTGQMDGKAFSKLRKAIKRGPWRDPSLIVNACDGEAWKIESYREDGSVEKTSGELGYIYGHRILETIVSLLPSNGDHCNSSAFIAIDRKGQSLVSGTSSVRSHRLGLLSRLGVSEFWGLGARKKSSLKKTPWLCLGFVLVALGTVLVILMAFPSKIRMTLVLGGLLVFMLWLLVDAVRTKSLLGQPGRTRYRFRKTPGMFTFLCLDYALIAAMCILCLLKTWGVV